MCYLLVVFPLVFQNKQKINLQFLKRVDKPPLVTLGKQEPCQIELFYTIPSADYIWTIVLCQKSHIKKEQSSETHGNKFKYSHSQCQTLVGWGMQEKFIIKILFFESRRKTTNCYWQSGWLANKAGDKRWHQEVLQSTPPYRLAGVVLASETSFRKRGKMWLDLELRI